MPTHSLDAIDLIVDADGLPWFFDANVLPGMTETSTVPPAIEASGRHLGDVYSNLAKLAATSRRIARCFM